MHESVSLPTKTPTFFKSLALLFYQLFHILNTAADADFISQWQKADLLFYLLFFVLVFVINRYCWHNPLHFMFLLLLWLK